MASEVQKKEKRIHNQVHDDAIWRQTINYELTTAKNWDRYFQKPSGENNVKLPTIATVPSFASGLPSKLPQGLSGSDTLMADWLYTYNVPRVIRYKSPSEKYKYPPTTSGEVGWMWTGTTKAISKSVPNIIAGQENNSKFKFGCNTDLEDLSKIPKTLSYTFDESGHFRSVQKGLMNEIQGNKKQYHTLERFGKQAQGRCDVLKWWGGGRESLP
ncbi:hypothetical protein HK096_002142 [Nowakowskiella sp. JEL0078]|nr:hypothetical protein HK096_002142 [Nowakowskiella sp. JEL0078]